MWSDYILYPVAHNNLKDDHNLIVMPVITMNTKRVHNAMNEHEQLYCVGLVIM